MKLVLLCVAFATWCTLVWCEEEVPLVSTEEGKVSGIAEEAANGNTFYSYYGIPYATPPVGDLRFKDPVEANAWQGVKDGSTMSSECLQVPFGAMLMGIKVPPEGLQGDEDCLYLNVFTPKVAHLQGNIPVMVFIHGGGFFAGSATEYQPHVLLSKDIILVVIQYRLGFLGFLSTEDWVIPGNYGLKDQTLALQWVQKNIKHFGGDPHRVTIFGESAGGASVHYQMLSPKAKGLFSGAIMQSGNALCPWALSADHRRDADKVAAMIGCSMQEGSHVFLKCMQSVSARDVTALMQDLPRWFVLPMVTVPRVDGDYLPQHPARLLQEGRYNKVNLITGVTAHEGAIFTQPTFAREDLIPLLENNFSLNGPLSLQWYAYDDDTLKLTHQIYNYYLGGINLGLENADDLTKMMSDRHFMFPHDLASLVHARESGVSTFRYELTHRGQMSLGGLFNANVGQDWVSHGDELFYLFRGGPLLQPAEKPPQWPMDLETQDDLNLRNIILTLWTNFAAQGHPAPADDSQLGFSWDATMPATMPADILRYLNLSPAPAMDNDSREEVRKFLSSLPTEINHLFHPHLIIKQDGETSSSTPDNNKQEL